jgi:hypothetical protein
MVFFSSGPLRDSAELTVRPGPPAALELTPAAATINAGADQNYAVDVRDAYGNVRAQATSLTIGPDGTCSGTTCTATQAGPHTVTATSGPLKATAAPTVRAAPLDAPPPLPTGTPSPAEVPTAEPQPASDLKPEAAPPAAVRHRFAGFFAPLRNRGLNRIKAGRTVKLKWRLTDAAGAPVTTLRTARLSVIPCGRRKGAGTRTVRPQSLGNGLYRIMWKSRRRDAGSCRRLRLELDDGTAHTVTVKLTRRSR